MKKILATLIAILIISTPMITYAKISNSLETENGDMVNEVILYDEENNVPAPKWEDYVPEKYQNPRTDFKRGTAIAELSVGILLTDLIITCPIGIPMICHATTKLKHLGYLKKKEKFEIGLEEAQSITNPEEKKEFYDALIVKCKLKDRREENAKKKAKREANVIIETKEE